MSEIITSNGIEIIRQRMDTLRKEMQAVMMEMKEVQDNSLSTEDSTETHAYNQRYESLELQYSALQKSLSSSTVVNRDFLNRDIVRVGNSVKLLSLDTNKEVTYQIVGSVESDPAKGKISYTSPIGKELMGLRVADGFELEIMGKLNEFEIIDIDIPEH